MRANLTARLSAHRGTRVFPSTHLSTGVLAVQPLLAGMFAVFCPLNLLRRCIFISRPVSGLTVGALLLAISAATGQDAAADSKAIEKSWIVRAAHF